MTYDCITFSFELDLLKRRLELMSPVVDKFVIGESQTMHSGRKKPMVLYENQSMFKEYLDRIIYVGIPTPPAHFSPRDREHRGRTALMRGLDGASSGDTVLFSDADEFVDPDSLSEWMPTLGIRSIVQSNCYYAANLIMAQPWAATRIGTLEQFKAIGGFHEARHYPAPTLTCPHGCHFSYFGGVESIQRKLGSFCHTELDKWPYNSQEWISTVIRYGLDLFNRPNESPMFVDPSLLRHCQLWPDLVHHKKTYSLAAHLFRQVIGKIKLRQILKRGKTK